MLLIAVGKLGSGPERDLVERFRARLRPELTVREIADGSGAPGEIIRREAAGILAALPGGAHCVALDSGGQALDSAAFAARLGEWREQALATAFVIGGAEGLGADVLERAQFVLSLGPMTWPHRLARVMLCEQIYRAQSILAGHPYHRAGRPQRFAR